VKRIALAAAIIAVCWATFVYAAVNTLCDENYWPE
jgi:hypothetical protein